MEAGKLRREVTTWRLCAMLHWVDYTVSVCIFVHLRHTRLLLYTTALFDDKVQDEEEEELEENFVQRVLPMEAHERQPEMTSDTLPRFLMFIRINTLYKLKLFFFSLLIFYFILNYFCLFVCFGKVFRTFILLCRVKSYLYERICTNVRENYMWV